MTTDLVHSCFLVDFSLFSVYFFNIYFWYRYCLSSCLEVFYKIWFLKCLQNSLENNGGAIFFSNKVASWRAANLLKTDSSTGGFPWILRVFKSNLFGKNVCKRLLLILECYSMISGEQYNYLIWSRYFHAISPNYTNEENLQIRFSCLMFLKIHALVSDMH